MNLRLGAVQRHLATTWFSDLSHASVLGFHRSGETVGLAMVSDAIFVERIDIAESS